jgi:hypothetical protein
MLINTKGVVSHLKPINMQAGQSSQIVELPANTLPGIYRLKVITPGNQQQILTVYLL